jgi:hypothetical protein
MACPYFYPVELRGCQTTHDAILPLGGHWTGVCHALPGGPGKPDDVRLRPLCNLGYARGNCACFPEGDGPDAVRFTIFRDEGSAIGIWYVVERDHHPFAHGRLEYSAEAAAFAEPPASAILARQAQAYAESYRRVKSLSA